MSLLTPILHIKITFSCPVVTKIKPSIDKPVRLRPNLSTSSLVQFSNTLLYTLRSWRLDEKLLRNVYPNKLLRDFGPY
jgi:hypothetical protein